jgi:1-deoxy-D-xylulose 5-phosphate reductoisomerase
MRKLAILGSTGSIGNQALRVVLSSDELEFVVVGGVLKLCFFLFISVW